MKLGYARVSTQKQDLDAQIDMLLKADCEYIYQEKLSGANKDRPELNRMVDSLQKGDVIVVVKLDRLGRSFAHLVELVEFFKSNDIEFVSLKENIDTSTLHGKMFFAIFAAIAEYERGVTSNRIKDALAYKKSIGIKLGRPKTDKKRQISIGKQAIKLRQQNMKVSWICEELGIERKSYYRFTKYAKDYDRRNNRSN